MISSAALLILFLSCVVLSVHAAPTNTTFHLDRKAKITRLHPQSRIGALLGLSRKREELGEGTEFQIVQNDPNAIAPEVTFLKDDNGETVGFRVTQNDETPESTPFQKAVSRDSTTYPEHAPKKAASPNETLITPRPDVTREGQLRTTPEVLSPAQESVEVNDEEYDRTKESQSTFERLRKDPKSILPALRRQAKNQTGEVEEILPTYNETAPRYSPKPTVEDAKEEDDTLETVSPADARNQERLHRKLESDKPETQKRPFVLREKQGQPVRFYEHLDDRPKVPEWVWVVVAAVGGLAVLASTIAYFRRRKTFEHGKVVDKTAVPIQRLTTPIVVV